MPTGTLWAFAGLRGNPNNESFAASNFTALSFDPWETALDGQGLLQGNILNRAGVLHLVAADIYLNIVFTQWTPCFGGGFSYVRATEPIPIPGMLPLVALIIGGLLRNTSAGPASGRPAHIDSE